jgi:quercetin dioxygenase-like cupin family protein
MIHTEPRYADLSPEMKQRLERFREEHKNDELGGVGRRVLFEDDRVKIWELILEPGEASDLHHHDHDYYLAIFEGDFVAGVTPEGSSIESFVGIVPELGNVVGIPKGETEWAYNVGEKTYREVIFELKDT